MSSLREMKGIKPKVNKLLKEFPHLRDDDNKLIANIWYNEVENILEKSAENLLKIFARGELTSPESIRRMRQKLQEENKQYRGEKYKSRHEEKEIIKKVINE